MPNSHKDPFPKDVVIKVKVELTSFVNLRIPVSIVIICVLLQEQREERMPTGKDRVVEHRKPVKEKYLAAEAVKKREVEFC
jgi:hypothetical protein